MLGGISGQYRDNRSRRKGFSTKFSEMQRRTAIWNLRMPILFCSKIRINTIMNALADVAYREMRKN